MPVNLHRAEYFSGDDNSFDINLLLKQVINDSQLSIAEVNDILDAISANNYSETFDKLLHEAELLGVDMSNTETINKNIRDVLVEYRQEKLAEYIKFDISNYSGVKQPILAAYVAQISALNVELDGFSANEIKDVLAVCNYSADSVLRKSSSLSAKEFKLLLLEEVTKNAARGQLNAEAVNIVVTQFNRNKYFK